MVALFFASLFSIKIDSSSIFNVGVNSVSAQGGGPPVQPPPNFYVHNWSPTSVVLSSYAKLEPSNPVTSEYSSYNGMLSFGTGKGSAEVGGADGTKYNVTMTHYSCKFSWLSPYCPQSGEHTVYTWPNQPPPTPPN